MIYAAMFVLSLAVLVLSAYVRSLYRTLGVQVKINHGLSSQIEWLAGRLTLNEARIAEIRRTQQAESLLNAVNMHGAAMNYMRN